jgi:heme exporter protein A
MRPTTGEALVHGIPPRNARGLVGVVSHTTYLYEELTALENLRFFGALYDVAAPAHRAAELLEAVGLTELASERVDRLSRGQQQRVAIARSLLHNPSLLLLDEPDAGLDLSAFQVLQSLITRGGHTVVLTTHNLAAGLLLGTRAAVLSRGSIVYTRDSLSPADAPELAERLRQLVPA